MKRLLRAGVVGATGYTGAELVRRLRTHPEVKVVLLGSESHAGRLFSDVHPGLRGLVDLPLAQPDPGVFASECDVVFLARPAGRSHPLAAELHRAGRRVIDLGADLRLPPAEFSEWYRQELADPSLPEQSVYGLTELYRGKLRGADLIANPGCYPTAAILAAAPILAAGIAEPRFVVDAKSGLSGAGRSAALATQWVESEGNVQPYAVAGEHRHTPEIEGRLREITGREVRISFSPHLVPMSRGILATLYFDLLVSLGTEDLRAVYEDYYRGESFVRVQEELPGTREVRGTNNCHLAVRVDRRAGRALIVSAIDNLGKGAAGQAIQNMNVVYGLPETLGLGEGGFWP